MYILTRPIPDGVPKPLVGVDAPGEDVAGDLLQELEAEPGPLLLHLCGPPVLLLPALLTQPHPRLSSQPKVLQQAVVLVRSRLPVNKFPQILRHEVWRNFC